jgi:hypothetical protein
MQYGFKSLLWILLLIGLVLKAFTHVVVLPDDPTVIFVVCSEPVWDVVVSDVPMPCKALMVDENGFIGEALYRGLTNSYWLGGLFLVLVVMLIKKRVQKY